MTDCVYLQKQLKEDLKPKDSTGDRPLFKMANRLYIEEKVILLEEFQRISKDSFDSEQLKADFENNSQQLVKEINQWIELETNNLIQNAIKEIDPQTAMLLLNVVYFKGKWKNRFEVVRPKEVTNLNGQIVQVDTMCRRDDYQFGQFDKYGIVQLDYIGDCSMYIVLPNKNVTLHDLLLELNARKLNEHLRELRTRELDLQLPKFKLETELDLKDMLEKLNVKTLFNRQANLSKVSLNKRLMVSKAMQNAYIAVDEDGTEAAAVTQVYFVPMCAMPLEPIKFHVNRPFIFLIRLNGVNIFVGAVKQF